MKMSSAKSDIVGLGCRTRNRIEIDLVTLIGNKGASKKYMWGGFSHYAFDPVCVRSINLVIEVFVMGIELLRSHFGSEDVGAYSISKIRTSPSPAAEMMYLYEYSRQTRE
ncbi:uncharacterized protein LAJ45_00705 [Morchella importuna]|uniref:uncharacterized protein n=1 Tax=Morchella importuna TaxID=1174673 RepID=UPI001E8E7253|nr:uncharacterized protein LAJ45_00705 [Morchella importuna]KAH8155695.1 hypothetical protein LAJ45_00705 [Morchella importuna]